MIEISPAPSVHGGSIPQPPELTRLQRGDSELVLAPAIGGSVVSLRVAGHEVLRSGSPAALEGRDPHGLGAFPLFPFSGRIANGRFQMGERKVQLPGNCSPEPHAIHGQAWQATWHVTARSRDRASLVYQHSASDWPWSYRAEQHFAVHERGLSLQLALCNLDTTSMPAGLGWHPYFPTGDPADAHISADVKEVWPSGDDMIPTAPTVLDSACDLRSPRRVSELRLDDAFNVGGAASLLQWRDRGCQVRLTASDALRHLVVFTPTGADYFCVEPVSHSPNAVNSTLPASATGYRILEPGESLSAQIELELDIEPGSRPGVAREHDGRSND